MRSGKEQGKVSRPKSAKGAVVAKSNDRRKKLKVVEVELRSKNKETKARSAKKVAEPVANTKKALTGIARAAKEVSGRALKVQAQAARKKTLLKKKALPLKPVKPQPAPPAPLTPGLTPEMLLSPPERILKPFRRAAEMNRQLAKKNSKGSAKKTSFLAKPNKKYKRYLVDLRVQSPGTVGYFANGGINPGPALVRLANVKGLDMIGLTDFYNAAYVDTVNASVTDSSLTILPGVDLCCRIGSCGEVYLTALFPEKTPASEIYQLLDELQVPKYAYGRKDYCLEMSFSSVIRIIEERGALVIPTRIDKTPYRQLAIAHLVNEFGFHAFDLAHPDGPELFRERWPDGEFTFFSFSNANALGQIGNRAGKVHLSQAGFQGLKELVARRVKERGEQAAVEQSDSLQATASS